ncbi:MAG: DinB family protein [Fimbriimonadales bacterium]
MQSTVTNPAQDTIAEAKAEFNRAKDRLAHCLATTPDDKINWSPSPTARTPIEVVVHAAMGTAGIHGMLQGKPFPFSGPDAIDAVSRSSEKEYKTREQVLGYLDQTSSDYLDWLDGLTAEQLASTWDAPFGTFPMTSAITFPADHLRNHAGQIDYIQTIYGDRDWHM